MNMYYFQSGTNRLSRNILFQEKWNILITFIFIRESDKVRSVSWLFPTNKEEGMINTPQDCKTYQEKQIEPEKRKIISVRLW